MHETSDEAADAIQVTRAKSINEIHGNYSRWGFHHPGPAYFYVYAAGEFLFYDTLKVVKSPFAAHTLAAILLQTFFFSIAMVWFAEFLKLSWALKLGLVLAAVHFSLLPKHFFSELPREFFTRPWFPGAILTPFMCLIASVLLLWDGKAKGVPIGLLSGFFILHGHLSSPLFVLPLWTVGFIGYGLAIKQKLAPPISLKLVLLAIAISSPFLMVWILDLLRGPESNLGLIVEHLRNHRGQRQPWALSLLYLSSYWTYISDLPFPLFAVGYKRALLAIIPKTPLILLGLISVCSVFYALIKKTGPFQDWEKRRTRALTGVLGLVLGLFVAWARMQDGGLYLYSSFLFNGVTFLFYWIWVCHLCSRLPQARLEKSLLYAPLFATVLFVLPTGFVKFQTDHYGIGAHAAVERHIEKSNGKSRILLTPNQTNWPIITSMALALERKNIPYSIGGMNFMFSGGEPLGTNLEAHLLSRNYEVWQVGILLPDVHCMYRIHADWCLQVGEVELSLDQSPIEFEFPSTRYFPFLPPTRLSGTKLLHWGDWQKGAVVGLPIHGSTVSNHVQLRIRQESGSPYTSVRWDGKFVQLGRKGEIFVSKDDWNRNPKHLLLIEFPAFDDAIGERFQAKFALDVTTAPQSTAPSSPSIAN